MEPRRSIVEDEGWINDHFSKKFSKASDACGFDDPDGAGLDDDWDGDWMATWSLDDPDDGMDDDKGCDAEVHNVM